MCSWAQCIATISKERETTVRSVLKTCSGCPNNDTMSRVRLSRESSLKYCTLESTVRRTCTVRSKKKELRFHDLRGGSRNVHSRTKCTGNIHRSEFWILTRTTITVKLYPHRCQQKHISGDRRPSLSARHPCILFYSTVKRGRTTTTSASAPFLLLCVLLPRFLSSRTNSS